MEAMVLLEWHGLAPLVPVLARSWGGVGPGGQGRGRGFLPVACRRPGSRPGRIGARGTSQGAGRPRWLGAVAYSPSVRAHCETVLRSFYGFHLEAGTGPLVNPFPLDRSRGGGRAHAHRNPAEPFRRERDGFVPASGGLPDSSQRPR